MGHHSHTNVTNQNHANNNGNQYGGGIKDNGSHARNDGNNNGDRIGNSVVINGKQSHPLEKAVSFKVCNEVIQKNKENRKEEISSIGKSFSDKPHFNKF